MRQISRKHKKRKDGGVDEAILRILGGLGLEMRKDLKRVRTT